MFMLSNADKFFYFLDNPHLFPTILGGDFREHAARMWKAYGADPAKFNSWWYNAYLKNRTGGGNYLPTFVDRTYFKPLTPEIAAMHAKVAVAGIYRDPPRRGHHQTGTGHQKSPCDAKEAVAFVHKYKKDAQPTADSLNVPLENILGLAASESRYGAPTNPDGSTTIAWRDNNYFSMHALSGDKKYLHQQPGVDMSHAKNPKDSKPIAIFLSFKDNVEAFENYWGKFVRGKKDPHAFGQALVDAKYNTERANFVNNLADVISAVRARLQCPEI